MINIRQLLAGIGLIALLFSASASYAYDRIKIHNMTTHKVHVNAVYSSFMCPDDDNWNVGAGIQKGSKFTVTTGSPSSSRGACMIKHIRVTGLPNGATAYHSGGGADFNFYLIQEGSSYKLLSASEKEDRDDKAKDAEMSPGFKITNNTNYPLFVSLNLGACLYYETVMPGKIFDRTTGAVWFDIKATMQINKEKPSHEEFFKLCEQPIEDVVGAAVIGFSSMYAASFLQSWWDETSLSEEVLGNSVTAAVSAVITKLKHMPLLNDYLGTELTMVYAGPPWPVRCTHKPAFRVTGGLAGGKHDKGWMAIANEEPAADGTQAKAKKLADYVEKHTTPLKIEKITGSGCG